MKKYILLLVLMTSICTISKAEECSIERSLIENNSDNPANLRISYSFSYSQGIKKGLENFVVWNEKTGENRIYIVSGSLTSSGNYIESLDGGNFFTKTNLTIPIEDLKFAINEKYEPDLEMKLCTRRFLYSGKSYYAYKILAWSKSTGYARMFTFNGKTKKWQILDNIDNELFYSLGYGPGDVMMDFDISTDLGIETILAWNNQTGERKLAWKHYYDESCKDKFKLKSSPNSGKTVPNSSTYGKICMKLDCYTYIDDNRKKVYTDVHSWNQRDVWYSYKVQRLVTNYGNNPFENGSSFRTVPSTEINLQQFPEGIPSWDTHPIDIIPSFGSNQFLGGSTNEYQARLAMVDLVKGEVAFFQVDGFIKNQMKAKELDNSFYFPKRYYRKLDKEQIKAEREKRLNGAQFEIEHFTLDHDINKGLVKRHIIFNKENGSITVMQLRGKNAKMFFSTDKNLLTDWELFKK